MARQRKRRTSRATKVIITGASVAATVATTGAIASADQHAAQADHEAELARSLVPVPPVVTTLAPRIVVIPRPAGADPSAVVAPIGSGNPTDPGAGSSARTATPEPGSVAPTPAPPSGGGSNNGGGDSGGGNGGGSNVTPPPQTAPPPTAPPPTSPPPTSPPPPPPTTSSGGS